MISCIKKGILASTLCVASITTLHATTSISIITPSNGVLTQSDTLLITGTVSLDQLLFTGTTPTNNLKAQLILNGSNSIGSAAIAPDYTWSYTLQSLTSDTYTIQANLMNTYFETFASDMHTFTVQLPPTIQILSPMPNEKIISNIASAYGTSSIPFAPVNITINNYVTTTTTNYDGSWQAEYNTNGGGQQTLLVELIQSGTVAASDSVSITPNTPLVFPITVAQAILVRGIIPTSSSGSGPGYSFVSTSTSAAITFDETFPDTPTVTATGESSSVFSAVSLSWVSTTSVNLFCTLGTDRIHFSAALLM